MYTNYFLAQEQLPNRPYEYAAWQLNWEQFVCFQHLCSGSQIRRTYKSTLKWMEKRSNELQQTQQSGWPYCLYGINFLDGEDFPFVWYETTSGTLVCASYSFVEGEENEYIVKIPVNRLNGHHHSILKQVLSGLTVQKEMRWHNCHCLPDKEESYREWSEWWNTVHAPKWGLDLVLTWEQKQVQEKFQSVKFRLEQIDEGLRYIINDCLSGRKLNRSLDRIKSFLEAIDLDSLYDPGDEPETEQEFWDRKFRAMCEEQEMFDDDIEES